MSESRSFDVVMAYIREQLEAYREDVSTRLQSISRRLTSYGQKSEAIEDRLGGILDVMESTVDVFLRHDAAIEMQLQVTRLWIFLSFLMTTDRTKEVEVLKFINATKDSLNGRLNEIWKSPLDNVVPIRNAFREELKQLARGSKVFD
jgi:hypothetical protein